MHIVSSVAVMNSAGQVLMGQRRDSGRWTLPGGHVDAGESPVSAAVRELHEETGLASLHKPIYLGAEDIHEDLRVHCFLAHVDDEAKPTTEQDPDQEVAQWVWIAADPIPPEVLNNLHARRNLCLIFLGLQKDPEIEELDIPFSEALMSEHSHLRGL